MLLTDLEKLLSQLELVSESLNSSLRLNQEMIRNTELLIKIEKLKEKYKVAPQDKCFKVFYELTQETWYAFPSGGEDSIKQEYYVLTNFEKNIIYSSHTYEGHACKRGWRVGPYHIDFDRPLRAIELFYQRLRDQHV